jgi:type II secretory pathway pseudopilin PulG
MITIAVVGVAVTAVVLIAFKWKASDEANAELKRIWQEGQEAEARVLSIGTAVGGMNGHPMIDFQLEVTLEGKEPYRASMQAMISKLAIARIQPKSVISVRVDTADEHKMVVDESLTPYGYK